MHIYTCIKCNSLMDPYEAKSLTVVIFDKFNECIEAERKEIKE